MSNSSLDQLADELEIKMVTAAELHAELDKLRIHFRARYNVETDADITALLQAGTCACNWLIEAWIETTALLGTSPLDTAPG